MRVAGAGPAPRHNPRGRFEARLAQTVSLVGTSASGSGVFVPFSLFLHPPIGRRWTPSCNRARRSRGGRSSQWRRLTGVDNPPLVVIVSSPKDQTTSRVLLMFAPLVVAACPASARPGRAERGGSGTWRPGRESAGRRERPGSGRIPSPDPALVAAPGTTNVLNGLHDPGSSGCGTGVPVPCRENNPACQRERASRNACPSWRIEADRPMRA